MPQLSVLAFEAFIQKNLATIQAQRLTSINPSDTVLQKKSQALLRTIPLIPFLDQLITYYNQYMPVYNAFTFQFYEQRALTPEVMQYHFHALQALHRALIKEQGMCWAELEMLLAWWVKSPYAIHTNHHQPEVKLFAHCNQFVKTLPQLVELNNEINWYELHIAYLKLQFFNEPHHKYQHKRAISAEKDQVRRLKRQEIEVINRLKTHATEVLQASDILRDQNTSTSIPIYLEAIHDIDFNWTQHCTIQHP